MKLYEIEEIVKHLLNTEYEFEIEKNKIKNTLKLTFDKDCFHHLLGFHKLSLLNAVKGNRAVVFDNAFVKANRIKVQTQIENHPEYVNIINRIEGFYNFFNNINLMRTNLYKFSNSNTPSGSISIPYEYSIRSEYNNNSQNYFMIIDSNTNNLVMNSCFQDSSNKYTIYQKHNNLISFKEMKK